MRLVELATELVTERGADTQALASSRMHGSQAGGTGSRINAYGRMERTSGGKGAEGLDRHPTLSELKRLLWSKRGPAAHIYELLKRD